MSTFKVLSQDLDWDYGTLFSFENRGPNYPRKNQTDLDSNLYLPHYYIYMSLILLLCILYIKAKFLNLSEHLQNGQ